MKRLALAPLLVTALAGSVILLTRLSTEASPDATITVDSTLDTNSRDDVVTLREAMMLATGDLSLDDLTSQECDQISGTYWGPLPGHCTSTDPPGAASADTIVFETTVFPLGSREPIHLGDTLPTLDTDNDTVDGSAAGVIVRGSGMPYFDCFRIISDYNTIKGLSITNCNTGVDILDGAQNNTVGSTTAGEGNVIAFNAGDGVLVEGTGATGNTICGNSIHSNTGLGIDLWSDGVTPNDPGDGDAGANNLQNFPVLALATSGSTVIEGTLSSTPNIEFRLEFSANAACDLSGYGEGETFLGSATVVTDGTGNKDFQVSFPAPVTVGQSITATATDPDNNTSEFSKCITVEAGPPGVGGIVELQVGGSDSAVHSAADSLGGSSTSYHIALAAAAAAVVSLTAGAWYARRRWLG